MASLSDLTLKSLKRHLESEDNANANKTKKIKGTKLKKSLKNDLSPVQAVPSAIEVSPEIRSEMLKRILSRNNCSVTVSNLPTGYNYASLLSIAPDMVTCRLQHFGITNKLSKIAFLEFSSIESALLNKEVLHGMEFNGKKLEAVIGGGLSIRVDDYNPLRINLSNLHWKCSKGELARHFQNATSIEFKKNGKKKLFRKRQGSFAVLCFSTAAEALSAIDEKQGCIIRGRRVCVFFERKKVKRLIIGLLVYGLSKNTKEEDIQALFPQASKITIHALNGFAELCYDHPEDSKLDRQNAMKMKLNGRKITVMLKYKHDEDTKTTNRVPKVNEKSTTSVIFVKNLGRSTTEKQVLDHFTESKILAMPKKKNGCRGYACLDFKTPQRAAQAISQHHEINGRVLKLLPSSMERIKKLNIPKSSTK